MLWRSSSASALLCALPTLVSLLAFGNSAAAAPIATAGLSLTAGDWDKNIKHGTWLVEHYSPYCSHCRSFAPTWKQLVHQYGDAASTHDFHFAQVDCAANGDLCREHDVKYYPMISLYTKGGKHVEEFEEKRTLEALGKFVEENYPVEDAKEGAVEETKSAVEATSAIGDEAEAPRKKVSGTGKARLPKAAEDDSALHFAKDDDAAAAHTAVDESVTDAAAAHTAVDESVTDAAAAGTAVTSQQTPPAAEATASPATKFSPPAFVAQAPPSSFEKKRGASAVEAGWPAIDGSVLELDNDLAVRLIEEDDAPPSFVKFFAPWCSHCKAMAPAWKDLAEQLAPAGVRVYQMDCDAKENKKACKLAKVQAYPTLKFFNAGAAVEYLGGRELESMKAFALKATSATTIEKLETETELSRAIQDDPVIVVMLEPKSAKKDDVDIALAAVKTLMGTAPVYRSTASGLFSRHSLPSDQLTFLTFKSHSSKPYDVFSLPLESAGTPLQRLEATRHWLRSAKLPLLSELSSATYNELLPSDSLIAGPGGKKLLPPLVGLAVLSRKGLGAEGLERAKAQVERIAEAWVEKRRARRAQKGVGSAGPAGGVGAERDVLWSWVDADRWAGWTRSMYDIQNGGKEGPRLVIADPRRMEYWSKTLEGEPLALDQAKVFELIEQGVYAGQVRPASSRMFLERFAYFVVDFLTAAYEWVVAHLLLSLVGFSIFSYLFVLGIRATFEDEPAGGRPARNGYAPVPHAAGPKRE